MYLVNDVHALIHDCGGICYLVTDVADIVDTCIGRGVHLYYVSGTAIVHGGTLKALSARVAIYGVITVDSLCKDLGTGRLTGTSGTAEKICVRKSSLL